MGRIDSVIFTLEAAELVLPHTLQIEAQWTDEE